MDGDRAVTAAIGAAGIGGGVRDVSIFIREPPSMGEVEGEDLVA